MVLADLIKMSETSQISAARCWGNDILYQCLQKKDLKWFKFIAK